MPARRPKPGARTPGLLAHLEEGSARPPADLNPGGRWERASAPELPPEATRGQPHAARRPPRVLPTQVPQVRAARNACFFLGPLPSKRQSLAAGERGTLDKSSGQESIPPGPQEAETVSGAGTPPKANQGLSRVGQGEGQPVA